MIKENYKIKVTPEQSRKVQKICFENGIGWSGSDRYQVQLTNAPHLFIYPNKKSAIRWGKDVDNFEDSPNQLVDAEKFIDALGNLQWHEKSVIVGSKRLMRERKFNESDLHILPLMEYVNPEE